MNNWYRAALVSALMPLIAGVVIFMTWWFTRSDALLTLGFYTIIACCILFVFGLMSLILAIRQFKKDDEPCHHKAMLAIVLLLANFPLAFGYGFCAEYLMSSHKISIVNNSDTVIDRVTFTDPKFYDYTLENIAPHSSISQVFHFRGEGTVKYEVDTGGVIRSGIVIGSILKGIRDTGSLQIEPDHTVTVGKEGESTAD